jgi:hypothetical protein
MTMIDSIQDDDDLYAQLKGLQRQEEFLDIQEEYIKDEMRNLKRELIRAREVSALLISHELIEIATIFLRPQFIIIYRN